MPFRKGSEQAAKFRRRRSPPYPILQCPFPKIAVRALVRLSAFLHLLQNLPE
jgi:hypothetical protein